MANGTQRSCDSSRSPRNLVTGLLSPAPNGAPRELNVNVTGTVRLVPNTNGIARFQLDDATFDVGIPLASSNSRSNFRNVSATPESSQNQGTASYSSGPSRIEESLPVQSPGAAGGPCSPQNLPVVPPCARTVNSPIVAGQGQNRNFAGLNDTFVNNTGPPQFSSTPCSFRNVSGTPESSPNNGTQSYSSGPSRIEESPPIQSPGAAGGPTAPENMPCPSAGLPTTGNPLGPIPSCAQFYRNRFDQTFDVNPDDLDIDPVPLNAPRQSGVSNQGNRPMAVIQAQPRQNQGSPQNLNYVNETPNSSQDYGTVSSLSGPSRVAESPPIGTPAFGQTFSVRGQNSTGQSPGNYSFNSSYPNTSQYSNSYQSSPQNSTDQSFSSGYEPEITLNSHASSPAGSPGYGPVDPNPFNATIQDGNINFPAPRPLPGAPDQNRPVGVAMPVRVCPAGQVAPDPNQVQPQGIRLQRQLLPGGQAHTAFVMPNNARHQRVDLPPLNIEWVDQFREDANETIGNRPPRARPQTSEEWIGMLNSFAFIKQL